MAATGLESFLASSSALSSALALPARNASAVAVKCLFDMIRP